MALLQGIALMAATMATGLMAGIFGLYAHTIMPGLRGTDDRTFVGAFQAVDRAIINPLFMGWFFGAPALSGAATALLGGERSVLPWVVAALVLHLAVVTITFAVHLPLNDAIKAATDSDAAAVRGRFREARWAAWNVIRALLATTAFGCLAWALAQYGRTVLS